MERKVTEFVAMPSGETKYYVTESRIVDVDADVDFTHEESYRLALESIERWGGNYRLSPAMRLRAIRAVVTAALSDQSV
jgi:hypothetical protein